MIPPGDGGGQEHGDRGEKAAQPSVGATRPRGLVLGGVAAAGDELALEHVQLEHIVGGHVEGGREAGPAVQLGRVAPGPVPFRRSLGDVSTQPAPLGVLLDPVPQAWPLAQQGLVGDLDTPFRHGHQSPTGQRGEDARRILVALEIQLGERRPPAHGRVRLPLPDQTQHDRPHQRTVRLGNTVVGALGEPGDGAAHSAGLVVRREGEGVVVSLLPQLEQRGGQQRQRARLAVHVGDQRVGQLRLDAQSDAAGGQLDGAT